MLTQSDIISFHNYRPLPELKKDVEALKRYGRPILCTEYMARPVGSRFDPILAYLKDEHVGAYNWGFVAGKSQTIYPWDSWQKPYAAEPPVWFHDIFRPDGTPYDPTEVAYIRGVTGKAAAGADTGSPAMSRAVRPLAARGHPRAGAIPGRRLPRRSGRRLRRARRAALEVPGAGESRSRRVLRERR